jgi:hypothetical protein
VVGEGDERRGSDKLPFTEQVERLGPGNLMGSLAGARSYLELIDWACRRLATSRAEFDVFRFSLPYPPVPASLSLRPVSRRAGRAAPGAP